VPCYKNTKYICAAVDSALNQTYSEVQIIVVNDGCPDTEALEKVLQPYLSRICYFRQSNKGAAAARNTAIRASHAKYILQLDADDMLLPQCVESQVAFMEQHPEYSAAYCNSINIAESEEAGALWGGVDRMLGMDAYPSNGPVSFCGVMESRTCPRNPGS